MQFSANAIRMFPAAGTIKRHNFLPIPSPADGQLTDAPDHLPS
jgi:hypothetical protein